MNYRRFILKRFLLSALTIGLMAFSVSKGYACTSFIVGEAHHQVFGRNYDFGFGDGYVMVNPKGEAKYSYPSSVEGEAAEPMKWIAKYGSVTFNQYGRGMPQGGMNEAGLVVETMALRGTKYPDPDSRPYFSNALVYRQYLLDTCATVQEVVEANSRVRISYDASKGIGAHWLVLDKTGDACIIEFLARKLVIYRGKSLPVRALTNDTYKDSLEFWGKRTVPGFEFDLSIHRFVTAADMVRDYPKIRPGSILHYANEILTAVAWGLTRWSIIYDNRNMKIYFHTDTYSKERIIDFKGLNFSCRNTIKILDINSKLSGVVDEKFRDYTPRLNADLVKISCEKLQSIIEVPQKVIDAIVKYPERFRCKE